MELNLYEDMLAEKRMKFYIDIYIHAHIYICILYIFFIRDQSWMCFMIYQTTWSHTDCRKERKLGVGLHKSLYILYIVCMCMCVYVKDTHKSGFSSCLSHMNIAEHIIV